MTSTTLTEEFGWEAYQNKYGETRTPLFVIDRQGLIKPFVSEEELEPSKGFEIIALEREEASEERRRRDEEKRRKKDERAEKEKEESETEEK